MRRIFITAAATVLLAACGTTGPGFLAEQVAHPTDEAMAKRCEAAGFRSPDGKLDLGPDIEKAAKERHFTVLLDRFLDCVLIDIPDGPQAQELKLLRGHYALGLIATYGAFNQTGALADIGDIDFRASKAKENAALMLAHIERAEDYLRRSSSVQRLTKFPVAPSRIDSLPADMVRVRRDYRALSVLRVAIDAERPTLERTRGFAIDVVAAVASPTPGALRAAARDGFNAMLKGIVMDTLGRDFLMDTQDRLARPKAANFVTVDDWAFGDALLQRACTELAKVAEVTPHCVPHVGD